MDCSLSLDMADWTDLPMDILVVIAESLTVIEDFTSFSAVCKEWQSATAILKKKPSLPTRYPRIMLSEKVDTKDQGNQDDRYFLNLLTSKTYQLKLPQASGRRCLGAHYGDTLWTNIQVPSRCYDDVLYYKGRFYAVDCHGVVVVCDINDNNDPKATVVAPAPSETHDEIQKYLVESSGDLLLVSRIRGGTLFEGDDDDNKKALYYTIDFSILKLEEYHEEGNNYAYKLTKVDTLEDRALFLGNNVSTSLPSSECIKANCIYFTDDNNELYIIGEPGGGGRDTGIFDIGNGTIQSNYAGESRSHLSPPLWYI
ncbi:F-box protein SKIP23 [Abeliophyllum distichum]|uniref:F-box protein SKIP23 n=1 Tax=Abeliophyllum distichum TaxID=126358 RepID=A0ABD1VRN7_9LAMI